MLKKSGGKLSENSVENSSENSLENSFENLFRNVFENSSENLLESTSSNSDDYEDDERKYDDMKLSYMMVRGNWEEWWLEECKESLDKCFNMISEVSSNKKAAKATPGSSKEKVTETQAERDELFSDLMNTQATATPDAVAPPLVENPSSVSDGLSILSSHPQIGRSTSDIFVNGSSGNLDSNKETIKELEDDLQRRTESLTNALPEIEKLKSELATKQAKCDSLQHQFYNNFTTIEDFAKGTKAHVKSVLARGSERITEDQRKLYRNELSEEDLKTKQSCKNLDTSSAPRDQLSDNYGIKQRADTQNRKLGLLKNQHYWEDKGYVADYLLITTVYPIYF